MCLAKAFINKWGGEPVLQDIARMRVSGDKVELESLFGEEKSLPGRIIEIDFATSKILLGQESDTDAVAR